MTFPFRKNLATWITLLLILAALGGIFVSYQKTVVEQQKREEIRAGENVPVALLNETEFDWGKIPRHTPVKQDFILSNPGSSNLEVTKIMTSCGCTTAELWIGDTKSDLPASIPPGSEGVVKVIFDPAVMKSRGKVKRAVRIETNEPNNPFLIINLQSDVPSHNFLAGHH